LSLYYFINVTFLVLAKSSVCSLGDNWRFHFNPLGYSLFVTKSNKNIKAIKINLPVKVILEEYKKERNNFCLLFCNEIEVNGEKL